MTRPEALGFSDATNAGEKNEDTLDADFCRPPLQIPPVHKTMQTPQNSFLATNSTPQGWDAYSAVVEGPHIHPLGMMCFFLILVEELERVLSFPASATVLRTSSTQLHVAKNFLEEN